MRIILYILLFFATSATAQNKITLLVPSGSSIDTTSLSNRINLKLNISDTAAMLGPYTRAAGVGLIKTGQTVLADTGRASAQLVTGGGVNKVADSLGALIGQRPIGTLNNSRLVFSADGQVKDTATLSYDRATGNVGIGTASPDASAILDISSNAKGFLVPRLTTTQRNAIVNPPNGLYIFNTTTQTMQYRGDSIWREFDIPNASFYSGSSPVIGLPVGQLSNNITISIGTDRIIGNVFKSDVPFEIHGFIAIVNNATAVTSGAMRIALYKFDNYKTLSGNLIVQSDTITVTTTGTKDLNIDPVKCTAGYYAIVLTHTGNGNVVLGACVMNGTGWNTINLVNTSNNYRNTDEMVGSTTLSTQIINSGFTNQSFGSSSLTQSTVGGLFPAVIKFTLL